MDEPRPASGGIEEAAKVSAGAGGEQAAGVGKEEDGHVHEH